MASKEPLGPKFLNDAILIVAHDGRHARRQGRDTLCADGFPRHPTWLTLDIPWRLSHLSRRTEYNAGCNLFWQTFAMILRYGPSVRRLHVNRNSFTPRDIHDNLVSPSECVVGLSPLLYVQIVVRVKAISSARVPPRHG
jgi:hypothetical protein